MAGDKVTTLAKPQLRGLLTSQIKRGMLVSGVLCVIGTVAFQFLYINAKKQRYADFYKDYDIEKEFEKMRQKGLFESC